MLLLFLVSVRFIVGPIFYTLPFDDELKLSNNYSS